MAIGTTLLLAAVLLGGPDVDALRRELDVVAARIEQLKARGLAGESVEGELEPLLVRSQELAEELERARPEPRAAAGAPAPDPAQERADELRDRAAALRAQAERLGEVLSALNSRIAAALRSATSARRPAALPAAAPELPRATLASTAPSREAPSPDATEIAALVRQRIQVEARLHALQADAAALGAAADALERGLERDAPDTPPGPP